MLVCRELLVALHCAALAFVFSVAASAQTQDTTSLVADSADAGSAITRFHSDVNVVFVPGTVTDRSYHPVTSLGAGDFQLFEDKHPQRIEYFYKEDAPISVGLVVDSSGSMQSKRELLFDSIRQFFNNANPLDEYFVVSVSTNPKVIASGTQSIHEIETSLSHEESTGWTALHDAIDLTIKEMKHSRYQRRVIVIISDGGENDSRISKKKLIKKIEESDADVYAIGVFDAPLLFIKPLEVEWGKHDLMDLTDVTAGRTITITDATKIPKTFADLSVELRNQYVLGYRPSRATRSGWRAIKVRLAPPNNQQGVHMFFKKGYYAPSP